MALAWPTVLRMNEWLQGLADTMVLGPLLERLRTQRGGYELLEHWTQGEFHHDVVVRTGERCVLVIATNCNGGVKEVLAFETPPDRWALWHWRCPHVQDFAGTLPPLLGLARTDHYFDPCELLTEDTRSELREEHRERQRGGGWTVRPRCR